jgi:hypothetical protein
MITFIRLTSFLLLRFDWDGRFEELLVFMSIIWSIIKIVGIIFNVISESLIVFIYLKGLLFIIVLLSWVIIVDLHIRWLSFSDRIQSGLLFCLRHLFKRDSRWLILLHILGLLLIWLCLVRIWLLLLDLLKVALRRYLTWLLAKR